MADLRVDLERLREVGTDLGRIGNEFDQANVRSDSLADATGHPGLADAVRSFAHAWDDTRADMLGGIQGMAEAASAIADAFTQTDGDLAAALTEASSPAPSGHPMAAQ
jgi:hypothetical protein